MRYVGHNKISKNDPGRDESWCDFVCGVCDKTTSAAVIAYKTVAVPGSGGSETKETVRWIECPSCGWGSVENDGRFYPGRRFGPGIEGLPSEVGAAYDEARDCMQVNAYTGAELVCRKILMHVACEKGAKEGKPFGYYLDYLEEAGFVPLPMKPWVDLIRKHANRSTHRLETPKKERAESTVSFTAQFLRMIYEMEHLASPYLPQPDDDTDSQAD